MDGETSWISHCLNDMSREIGEIDSYSDLSDEGNKEVNTVSADLILPDHLLERILANLPIPSIFRAGCVCKRWNEIVSSERFLWNFSSALSQMPWYFMFTSSNEAIGYAYDPLFRKWYGLEIPCIGAPNWFIATSHGLVCSMDNDTRSELSVCNPITRQWRRLDDPPGLRSSDYTALAIHADRASLGYTISIVRSIQVPGNFFQCDVSIHLYDSVTVKWVTPLTEVLTGWRAGGESVICDGILYFLIYSTGGGAPECRHGLVNYDLVPGSSASRGSLIRTFVPVPCALTCGRLMNLKERLVMVGGIGKHERPDIIKGIGIWVLNSRKEWEEIARMPHKLFQGFGEFDDVFASSGADDVVYIQSYGAPVLLMYDMGLKMWKWSQKCPVTKKFPLQLFTGFCFEPRLEISP